MPGRGHVDQRRAVVRHGGVDTPDIGDVDERVDRPERDHHRVPASGLPKITSVVARSFYPVAMGSTGSRSCSARQPSPLAIR